MAFVRRLPVAQVLGCALSATVFAYVLSGAWFLGNYSDRLGLAADEAPSPWLDSSSSSSSDANATAPPVVITPYKVGTMAASYACRGNLDTVLWGWLMMWMAYGSYYGFIIVYIVICLPIDWLAHRVAPCLFNTRLSRAVSRITNDLFGAVVVISAGFVAVLASSTLLTTLALPVIVPVAARHADPDSHCASIRKRELPLVCPNV